MASAVPASRSNPASQANRKQIIGKASLNAVSSKGQTNMVGQVG